MNVIIIIETVGVRRAQWFEGSICVVSSFLSFIAYSIGALLCPQYVATHLE